MAASRETPDVLLVGDNEDLRYVLATVPLRHGYRVVEAVDEPAAVESLRLHRPSLVLSDLRLPHGDVSASHLSSSAAATCRLTAGRATSASC